MRVLPLDLIRLDGNTQGREHVNWDVVDEYAAALAAGAKMPPLVVYHDGDDYWLADGFHRVHALRKLAWPEWDADVRPGSHRDAVLAACGANVNHGLRRTNGDKRRAVLALLRDEEWSQWSDREIARRCGVDHRFVGAVRSECFSCKAGTVPTLQSEAVAAVLLEPVSPAPPQLYSFATPEPATTAVDELPQPIPPPSLMSSASREWYTPSDYIAAVRDVLGAIDLDPASSALANDRVGATRYLTQHDDGMTHDWHGRVFLNPPYGREDGEDESNQERWSHRLIDQYRRGITTAAVLLVNATPSNKWWAPLWSFPVCFTDHRIRFWGPGGDKSAPTHSNAFIYLGPDVDAFDRAFSRFGVVVVRRTDWSQAGA